MKRVIAWIGILLGVVGLGFGLIAAQYEPKASPGAQIGEVPIAGLTADQAAFRVREWWEQEKSRQVQLTLPNGANYRSEASSFGLDVDERATVALVDFESLWDALSRSVKGSAQLPTHEVKFVAVSFDDKPLHLFVEKSVPERRPARVYFREGSFERVKETAGFKLDKSKLFDAALTAFLEQSPQPLPIIVDEKKVPDAALEKIADVVTEFSTKFSEGKASRSHNIRLAARKIDGLVLAPGESFSFNNVVGRRTRAAGFKEAGVYKDGKHDIDLGGGICQVSTTLYNAVLLANLKITRRQNHSMPVPYVALGRDAAVDYGTIDLGFQNTLDVPVAVNAVVTTGQITFRILGLKDPSLAVKIETSNRRSWGAGEKTVPDPSLPEGKRRIIEKGGIAASVNSHRVVYRNGVEVAREALGRSHYRGGVRIIAVGTAKPTVAPDPLPLSTNAPNEFDE